MSNPELIELAQQAARELLMWVGFGTLVGLSGKALMPGRDPGGAIGTMLMGIAGSVIGCGIMAFFFEGAKVTPVSGAGFLVGTGGVFLLLFFYRLLAGSFIAEAEEGERYVHKSRRRRRKRRLVEDV